MTTIVSLALFYLLMVTNDVTGVSDAIQQPWYCDNENQGIYQPCPFSSSSVGCTYTKGLVNRTVEESGLVPSRATNVLVSSYTAKYFDDPEYYQAINITWQLPQDASYSVVTGFQLVLNYTDAPNPIIRTFMINQSTNSSYLTQWKNVYYYDCIFVYSGTQYELTLYSLPVTSLTNNQNIVKKTYITANKSNSTQQAPNANNSADWQASMLVAPNPDQNSIQVCFTPAPEDFKFTVYIIQLIRLDSGSLNIVEQKQIVTPDSSSTQTCVDLLNVRPDDYKIWLTADDEGCVCRRPGYDSCTTDCIPSEVSPIDMTSAPPVPVTLKQSTPTIGPTPSPHNQTNSIYVQTSHPVPNDPNRIGLIVGLVFGCAIIMALIILIIVRYRIEYIKKRDSFDIFRPNQCKIGIPDLNKKIVSIPMKKVLLIYSRDNEAHRKVVCRFATFLHKCCECDVSIDEWSMHEISGISSCTWLTQRIENVDNIIIIHSEGGFRRYKEASMYHKEHVQPKCVPPDDPFDDLFVVALRFLQNDHLMGKCDSRNCFHVYFPQYTDKQHVVDVKFGKRYPLMTYMEDLYLHLHELNKYCKGGQHTAHGRTCHDYASTSEEGKQLEQALLMAVKHEKNCAMRLDEPNTQRTTINIDHGPNTYIPIFIPPDMDDQSIDSATVHSNSDASPVYNRDIRERIALGQSSFDNDYDGNNSLRLPSDDSAFFSGNLKEVVVVPPCSSSSLRSSNVGSMEEDPGVASSDVWTDGRSMGDISWIAPTRDDDDSSLTSFEIRRFQDEYNGDE